MPENEDTVLRVPLNAGAREQLKRLVGLLGEDEGEVASHLIRQALLEHMRAGGEKVFMLNSRTVRQRGMPTTVIDGHGPPRFPHGFPGDTRPAKAAKKD